jgi:D-xylose transport system substrate-binding protein
LYSSINGPRALAFAAAVALACCSCGAGSPDSAGIGGPAGPHFFLTELNSTFSAMSKLEPLAGQGKGSIAVVLPSDSDGSHFRLFDAPYFRAAFRKAALAPSQYEVQTPPDSNQLAVAKRDINDGASVLVVDARYSGAGVAIEAYARAHGVPVIDYDWLTLGGTRGYYVGFDSLKIGVLLGEGLVNCVHAWGVRHPQVMVMSGGASDYNAGLYAGGYDAVLARQFSSGWTDVADPPGTWDSAVALSEFQQAYTAHPNINAALIPNDENAAPIIAYLESRGVKPRTFPTTGLDATLAGLQNVLAGYQCGTVYKPIYLEAEAAAALAIYLWAGVTPPVTLLNWTVTDPQTSVSVPSVLLTPEWITTANMNSTVIADKYVTTSRLCAGSYASLCLRWNIRLN